MRNWDPVVILAAVLVAWLMFALGFIFGYVSS